MDMNTKAKQSVLEELIKLMESKELEGLKSKSPKFGMAKIDITTAPKEEDTEEEQSETSEEAKKELLDPSLESKESNPEDDLDLERLKELYAKLK